MILEAYFSLFNSSIQAVVALMGIVAVVLIFTVETKMSQAKKICDELSIKYINNELDNANVKKYLGTYVSKLHDTKLDSFFSLILGIFYLLSSLIVICSLFFLLRLSYSFEGLFVFILLFIMILVFLILIFQILDAPYSRIFRKWKLNYLLKQPQYSYLSDYIGFFDMEDLEKLESKKPR